MPHRPDDDAPRSRDEETMDLEPEPEPADAGGEAQTERKLATPMPYMALEPRPSWPPVPPRAAISSASLLAVQAPIAAPAEPSGSFTDTSTWTARAEAFLDQIDHARSGEQRARLYRELATMLETRLDDPQQAFDALVAAFTEDVSDDETARALERLARRTDRFGELIESANAWLEEPETKGNPARTLTLLLRLAKWYGEDVDRPEWALPYLERAQALAPRDVRPFRVLARIRKRTGDVDRAGATLMSALELATEPRDRREIHVEIGELLWKHKAQTDAAIASFRRALDVDPGHLPAIDALEAIHRDRGQLQPIAELLERKLTHASAGATNPAESNATRVRLAELYAGPLAQPEKATRLLEKVLRDDPDHDAGNRGLAALHRRLGNTQGLRALLERRLEGGATARDRVEVLLELAELLERTFLEHELAAYRLEQALTLSRDDERVLEALERIYARLHRFTDLAATLEQHAGVAREPSRRAELYAQLARVVERELADEPRAHEAWTQAADLVPDHPEAMAALARLDARSGDPTAAIQRLRRAAIRAQTPPQSARAHHALGLALLAADDGAGARESFLDALDHDPDHLASLTALRALLLDHGEDAQAIRFLERETTLADKPRTRAALLAKLGHLRLSALGDAEGARAAWEEAVAIDPDGGDALLPLAEACLRDGEFARAEPMFAKLRMRAAAPAEKLRLAGMHGRALAALGRNDAAIAVLREAHAADPADLGVLDSLADAAWAGQNWPYVLEVHQRLLAAVDDEERRLVVLHRIACAQRALGKTPKAIATLEHVLESDPDRRDALTTLASIYEEAQDWPGVAECQRRLADSAKSVDEKLAALDVIADTWWKRASDAPRAIEAIEEALADRPRDLTRLHRLLGIAQATQDWGRVLDTLRRIADVEENPVRRSKQVLTMGQLYRDAMGDDARALECFERALDDDPKALKAFESIDRLLTARRDWPRLERAYRKMLHRVTHGDAAGTEVEFHLWTSLGIIYRDRLHEDRAAADAFRMAAKLRPADERTRRILADLLERGGRSGDAAAELFAAIAREPRRSEPYRQLYRIFRREGAFDRAYCVASTLAFLQQADAEQRKYLEGLTLDVPREPTRALDAPAFQLLVPSEHDVVLGKLFELLVPGLRAAKLRRLAAQGKLPEPPPSTLHVAATSKVPIVRDLAISAAVLGLPAPRISVRPDVEGGLAHLLVDPPASVVGAGALTVASPFERRFLAARHVAGYRGELYVNALVAGPAELKALSLTALQLSQVDVPLPDELARVAAETARELAQYLQPVQLEALRKVMRRFVERGGQADVRAWWKGADRLATRCGLLLCGDVAVAARACAAAAVGPYDATPTERIEDLLVFSVSEGYFAAREAIGVRVAE